MDLKNQLQNLFPDHEPEESESDDNNQNDLEIWLQDEPLLCKYEKRKGKPNTIIENYNGAKSDFKTLTKHLKKLCSVGGSHDQNRIIIQGDFRDKIMEELKDIGFNVKRIGG
jgi:translation initiation factor 1